MNPTQASGFEASSFEPASTAAARAAQRRQARFVGWRRRVLTVAALLGCVAVFALAHWLAEVPHLDLRLAAGPRGELVLRDAGDPALRAFSGRELRALALPGQADAMALTVSGALLHRAPRWQPEDADRAATVREHEAVAALLERAAAQPNSTVVLLFADGSRAEMRVAPRGVFGLGVLFWPLVALALLLYLCAMVVVMSRGHAAAALYALLAQAQSINLLFIAAETTRGLGLPLGAASHELWLRAALDLITGAAIVHAFALHPRRLPRARRIALVVWGSVLAWLLLAATGQLPHTWWWAQAACLALGLGAVATIRASHRLEPNPWALVMQRLTAAAVATLVLASAAVAWASLEPTAGGAGPAHLPAAAPVVASAVSVAWYLFVASLLLLPPFLAKSRQLLREFALLAGVSTVATSLDLLLVSVLALGPLAALAAALAIALALYAGARQWLLQQVMGNRAQSTERAFELLYRAAREVRARPVRYPQALTQLLRDLFEPLEIRAVTRVPVRARLHGDGSALVVPLRARQRGDGRAHAGHNAQYSAPYSAPDSAEDSAQDGEERGPSGPTQALELRFARRGLHLFTIEDARLADRMVDQLQRAMAYDQAVERGRSEERLRIAQDLHDDIGARLLTLMYRAPSREMEDYIRHTLQDLKTLTRGLAATEHRLSHAAAEWKADLTQRLAAAQAELRWHCEFDTDMRLSVVQWSALTRVLRELVSNAMFHGHATQVDVQLRLAGRLLELRVADDGQGRAPEAWSHGLGLGGVRKRVKAIGGEVAWREADGGGIVCEARMPGFGHVE